MKIKGVSSAIISAVRDGVREQLNSIAKYSFDCARMQFVEKQFIVKVFWNPVFAN